MNRNWFVVIVVLSVASRLVEAQRPSLRDAAKMGIVPRSSVTVFYPTASIPDVWSRAETVIHGIITDVNVHFSPDESNVVTDYSVTAFRAVKQSPKTTTAKVPGLTRPVVVRCLGGTLSEQGIEYSTDASPYPATEAFKVGEHVVLFLVYKENEGVYALAYGPFGAFRVIAGQVVPMTTAVAQLRGDRPRPLEAFLAELSRGPK